MSGRRPLPDNRTPRRPRKVSRHRLREPATDGVRARRSPSSEDPNKPSAVGQTADCGLARCESGRRGHRAVSAPAR